MNLRGLLAIVLLASAAMFAVGSQIERNTETAAEATASPAELRHDATTSRRAGAGTRSDTGNENRRPDRLEGDTATEAAKGADTGQAAKSSGTSEPTVDAAKPAARGKTSGTGEGAKTSGITETAREGAASETGARDSGGRGAVKTRQSSPPESAASHRAELHKEARLLGINPEAVGLVIAAVLASVVLAAAVWLRPLGAMLIGIVAFGLVFAGFDAREVLHQIDESRASLIVIAGVLVALHLLVAGLAGVALVRNRPRSRAAPV